MSTSDIDKDRSDLLGSLIKQAGPRMRPPSALETKVRDAVYAEWQRGLRTDRRRRATQWLAAAAVASIALVLGWRILNPAAPAVEIAMTAFSKGDVLINSRPVIIGAQVAVREGDEVKTGSESGVRLELKNALSVRLAANSVARWRNAREVELIDGSIYVDSGQQHAPLAISTRYGVVSHLGTRYKMRADGDALTVSIREGRVEVTNANGKASGVGGQEFSLNKSGQIQRNKSAPFGDQWAWVDALAPHFDIEKHSLKEFLEWAASETGRTLEYVDAQTEAAAANTTLHGSSASLSPTEAIAVIMPTTDFVTRYDGERLIIAKR